MKKLARARRRPEKPDCMSCGACCVSLYDQDAFCDIDERDVRALGAAWAKRNVIFTSSFDILAHALGGDSIPHAAIKTKWVEQKAGPLKGAETCTCVALKGSLMKSVKCSIYEKRPRTCRVAVSPGDRTCLEIRRMFQDLIEKNAPKAVTA